MLITGSTDGLGRRVARDLAAGGATVIVHGRSEERGRRAVAEIIEETGNEGTSLVLADLASLEAVRALARHVRERTDRLHVLVNNAGIGAGPRGGEAARELSADRYELRFAVNYLSHFLLTHLLLDLLRASAPARIVDVASIGQHPIDFDDVMLEHGYDGFRAYAQSKLAQVMFTFELADRLGPSAGVTVNALHPATLMDTKMVFESFGSARTRVEDGARATERLIADPALDGVTGRYFDATEKSRADPQAYDPEARRRLWELSERLTGVAS